MREGVVRQKGREKCLGWGVSRGLLGTGVDLLTEGLGQRSRKPKRLGVRV